MKDKISRRSFFKGGLAALFGTVGMAGLIDSHESLNPEQSHSNPFEQDEGSPSSLGTVGVVDHQRNGFDPMQVLVDWDYGKVTQLPNGQTLREYEFVAIDKEIEVAPGIFFPAWTYNGRIPGPTIRCVEGDRIRIKFHNEGSHPHTIHFHGFPNAASALISTVVVRCGIVGWG